MRFQPTIEDLPVLVLPGDLNPMDPIVIDYRKYDVTRTDNGLLAENAIKSVITKMIEIVVFNNDTTKP